MAHIRQKHRFGTAGILYGIPHNRPEQLVGHFHKCCFNKKQK
jgi:hypothetical protein